LKNRIGTETEKNIKVLNSGIVMVYVYYVYVY